MHSTRLWAALAATLLLLAPLARVTAQEAVPAPGIVISTGLEGGGYWNAGTRLQGVAEELAFEVEVRTSDGSLDNLNRLIDPAQPVNLALAQADALQYFLGQQPAAEESLEVLESIGQECVFMLTGSSLPIRSDADLQAGTGYRLGISSPESGIAVTWEYMKTLTPELANTTVVYTDTRDLVPTLNAGDRLVDAIMMVHRPKAHSPEVDQALANLVDYRFVKLRDPRLQAPLPNGEVVYQLVDLALPHAERETRHLVRTMCVDGLLLANRDKLTAEQRNQVAEVLDYHWMRVYQADE